VFGISIRYGLDGPVFEPQCRMRFFRPSRPVSKQSPTTSLMYNGYQDSFRVVKRLGLCADHPTVRSRVLCLLGMLQDSPYCNSRLPFGETAKETCNYEILISNFHITDRIIATAIARIAAVHAGSFQNFTSSIISEIEIQQRIHEGAYFYYITIFTHKYCSRCRYFKYV
jgi:hypothetical protein